MTRHNIALSGGRKKTRATALVGCPSRMAGLPSAVLAGQRRD